MSASFSTHAASTHQSGCSAHLIHLAIQEPTPRAIYPQYIPRPPTSPPRGAHPILPDIYRCSPRAAHRVEDTSPHMASAALSSGVISASQAHTLTPAHPFAPSHALADSTRAPTVCPPTAWSTKKNARDLRVQRASPSAACDQSASSRLACRLEHLHAVARPPRACRGSRPFLVPPIAP